MFRSVPSLSHSATAFILPGREAAEPDNRKKQHNEPRLAAMEVFCNSLEEGVHFIGISMGLPINSFMILHGFLDSFKIQPHPAGFLLDALRTTPELEVRTKG